MLIVRAVFVWFGIICAESLQGLVRMTLLATAIGDEPARQLAVLTGSCLVLLIAWMTAPVLGLKNRRDAMIVGVIWVALTLAFELALGRATGATWQRLLSDFDIAHGGLLPLGLVVMLLAPLIVMTLRRR